MDFYLENGMDGTKFFCFEKGVDEIHFLGRKHGWN